MRKDEAIQTLRKEIQWCAVHPDKNLSAEYRRGFIDGLRQAITILDQLALAIRAQGWRETDALVARRERGEAGDG